MANNGRPQPSVFAVGKRLYEQPTLKRVTLSPEARAECDAIASKYLEGELRNGATLGYRHGYAGGDDRAVRYAPPVSVWLVYGEAWDAGCARREFERGYRRAS